MGFLDGGNGNGYNWQAGMSNNAVSAYENGEMPLSKWTKDKLMSALEAEATEEVYNILKVLPVSVLKEEVLEKSSWHHTSKYFNETQFYSIRYDIEFVTVEDAKRFVDSYLAYKQECKEYQKQKKQIQKKSVITAINCCDNSIETLNASVGTFKEENSGLYFEKMCDIFNGQDLPISFVEFLGNPLELSQSGNIYRQGEKPRSEYVEEGTRRISFTSRGYTLQEYRNGAYVNLEALQVSKNTYGLPYDLITKAKGTYSGTMYTYRVLFKPFFCGRLDATGYKN